MPLEFSVAAFRFGHSMVRGEYDFNRNFGRPGLAVPDASFFLIFAFTGKGFPQPFFGATDVLPFNWVIDWDRFVHKGSSFPDHFARQDRHPADAAAAQPVQGGQHRARPRHEEHPEEPGHPQPAARLSAVHPDRAGRRGRARGTPLTAHQLTAGQQRRAQRRPHRGRLHSTATPLWYYILKEAEVQANGDSLGEVGSRIVNETIIGQLRADSTSYLNRTPDWDPSMGLTLPNGDPIVTIADFLTVAGVR